MWKRQGIFFIAAIKRFGNKKQNFQQHRLGVSRLFACFTTSKLFFSCPQCLSSSQTAASPSSFLPPTPGVCGSLLCGRHSLKWSHFTRQRKEASLISVGQEKISLPLHSRENEKKRKSFSWDKYSLTQTEKKDLQCTYCGVLKILLRPFLPGEK